MRKLVFLLGMLLIPSVHALDPASTVRLAATQAEAEALTGISALRRAYAVCQAREYKGCSAVNQRMADIGGVVAWCEANPEQRPTMCSMFSTAITEAGLAVVPSPHRANPASNPLLGGLITRYAELDESSRSYGWFTAAFSVLAALGLTIWGGFLLSAPWRAAKNQRQAAVLRKKEAEAGHAKARAVMHGIHETLRQARLGKATPAVAEPVPVAIEAVAEQITPAIPEPMPVEELPALPEQVAEPVKPEPRPNAPRSKPSGTPRPSHRVPKPELDAPALVRIVERDEDEADEAPTAGGFRIIAEPAVAEKPAKPKKAPALSEDKAVLMQEAQLLSLKTEQSRTPEERARLSALRKQIYARKGSN